MRTLILQPRARLDLLEIWVHLAEENIEAAVRFNEQVDKDFERLEQFPEVGHRRSDLTKADVRFWKNFSWFVIYRFDDKTVIILRVIHTRRNIKSMLRSKN